MQAPTSTQGADGCSAWNPGIDPDIPREYRELETIYRPECVSSRLRDVDELAGLTGLPHEELVVFLPQRLVLHELIVRVTADIVVSEGEEEEEFGRNFRDIAWQIHDQYVAPRMPELAHTYARLRERVVAAVHAILDETLFEPPPAAPPARRRFPFGLFAPQPSPAQRESVPEREHRVIAQYKEQGLAADDPFERAVHKSLYRVLGGVASARGRVGSDRALLTELVCNHVCNSYGSQVLGREIAPLVDAAIEREGYTRIRNRAAPILISLKGASAAGKSSLRPMLKQTLREQGIEPDGYATISPDVWRRMLLDYDSLGPAYKYSGPFTSREVMAIDGKLDRYIRYKANRDHAIPHFLVDRFRFDSFSSEQVARVLHDTYAKYVDVMYMYFVVTAPEETVERGWQRGIERGRYKAVEDFLGHAVEAYVGMPKILFKWLAYERPLYRYFFLDNMVPKGTFPKTIATGTQEQMTIFDPLAFVAIERYQKINIKARSPEEVYPPAPALEVERNCGFLEQCVRRIPRVSFVEPASGTIYVEARDGQPEVVDAQALSRVLADEELARVLRALAPQAIIRAAAGSAPAAQQGRGVRA